MPPDLLAAFRRQITKRRPLAIRVNHTDSRELEQRYIRQNDALGADCMGDASKPTSFQRVPIILYCRSTEFVYPEGEISATCFTPEPK